MELTAITLDIEEECTDCSGKTNNLAASNGNHLILKILNVCKNFSDL